MNHPDLAARDDPAVSSDSYPLTLRLVPRGDTVQVTWEANVIGSRSSEFRPPYDAAMLPLVIKALDAAQWPSHPLKGPQFDASERDRLAARDYWADGRVVTDIHRRVGRELYVALVADPKGATALRTARDHATEKHLPLAYLLRFPPEATELTALPWELLWDDREPLLFSRGQLASCVRYLDLDEALPQSSRPGTTLRLLAIAPLAQVPEKVRQEERAARTAWAELIRLGNVTMEELSPATPKGLVDRIQGRPPVDILHFYGHGRYKDGHGALLFDAVGGGETWLDEKKLTASLGEARLIILHACQSAMVGSEGLLTGVAPALSAAGVPAVVAMQLTIRVAAAARFAEVFYRSLARGESVQNAVSQARQALYVEESDGASWYVPTLTIRARDTGPLRLMKPGDTAAIADGPRVAHMVHNELKNVRESIKPEATKPFGGLSPSRSTDWCEAPDVRAFFGRTEERATLEQWILNDGCRLVAILGIAGIGKTSLSLKLARGIQDTFDHVIWRSLNISIPPVLTLLSDWVKFLSDQQDLHILDTLGDHLSRLLYYLQERRCLLILDNVEAILQGGDRAGQYKEDYEGYGHLFKAVGDAPHNSCLLLTSREKPPEIASLEGEQSLVRSQVLKGVHRREGRAIVEDLGSFSGSDKEWDDLVDFYGGNPLALRLAAQRITEGHGGNISTFLRIDSLIFKDIRKLLDWYFTRLSVHEREIMYWLAINREPVLPSDLKDDTLSLPAHKVIDELQSLQRKLLLERNETSFTLQPVLIEYITERFIALVYEEISTGTVDLFNSHALLKALAKDHVRDAQSRLILKPLIERLLAMCGGLRNLAAQLKRTLSTLRQESPRTPGYAGGNILNLLNQMALDLCGYDFSYLTVWQAHLQDVNLHQVNFSYADLSKSVFTQRFGSVLSVTFSPDGTHLATGDAYGGIFLWDVSTGQLIDTFPGHAAGVTSVAFSPDGNTLASVSRDQTVRIWETGTHKYHTLLEHIRPVTSAAFNLVDGRILAIGSLDHNIYLYDIMSNSCIATLEGHADGVRTVAFSPDGQRLASGDEAQQIHIWESNKHSFQHRYTLPEQHTGVVSSVAFSPKDAHILASGSHDHTIKIWNVVTRDCLDTLSGHIEGISAIAFSPNGRMLVSSSYDCTVKVWDMSTCRCCDTLQEHTGWVWAVAFNADEQTPTFASGSEDQSIKIVRSVGSRGFKYIHDVHGHIGGLRSLAFSPDGRTLASGSHDGIVRLWDMATDKCYLKVKGHTMAVRALACGCDGKTIASGSDDCTIKIWEVNNRTYECKQTVSKQQGHTSGVRALAFSPDRQLLASGGYDQSIKLWKFARNKYEYINTLLGEANGLWSIAFSPDGKALAYGSDDDRCSNYSIVIWDVGGVTPQRLHRLEGHTKGVRAVAFCSYKGQTILASGSADHTIKIWVKNSDQYECMRTLEGHSGGVWSVCFSPDGQHLASGGDDQTVRLWKWSIDPYQCLYTLRGHTDWVRSVVFSPNGSLLASSSEDETIRLWSAKTGKHVKSMADRPYEGMNICGVTGLSEAQKATLKSLGAMPIAVNHVEWTNRWLRFWEKVRYKWRRLKQVLRCVL